MAEMHASDMCALAMNQMNPMMWTGSLSISISLSLSLSIYISIYLYLSLSLSLSLSISLYLSLPISHHTHVCTAVFEGGASVAHRLDICVTAMAALMKKDRWYRKGWYVKIVGIVWADLCKVFGHRLR